MTALHRSFSRLTSLALLVAATACLPPERPPSASGLHRPQAVRVSVRPADAIQTGTLVRLTSDSVVWHPDTAELQVRALPLETVTRVEVAEPLSQRAAARRGLIKGAVVGAALGAGLVALRPQAAGGAVALALGSAWLGSVFAGQQVEGPRPPVRWRVVHPRARGASGDP